MKARTPSWTGAGLALLVVGMLTVAVPADAQTQGMNRRADRRGDRQTARGTRQSGREDARAAKHQCLAGDQSRAECRQTKRGMKQGSREKAREQKYGDGQL
jgi:hypothetical protein